MHKCDNRISKTFKNLGSIRRIWSVRIHGNTTDRTYKIRFFIHVLRGLCVVSTCLTARDVIRCSLSLTLNVTAVATRRQLLAYTSPPTAPPPPLPATAHLATTITVAAIVPQPSYLRDRRTSLAAPPNESRRPCTLCCSAHVRAASGGDVGMGWQDVADGGGGGCCRAGDLRAKIRYPVAWRRVGTLVFRETITGPRPYSFLVVFFSVPSASTYPDGRVRARSVSPPLSPRHSVSVTVVGPPTPLHPLLPTTASDPLADLFRGARDTHEHDSCRSAIYTIERRQFSGIFSGQLRLRNRTRADHVSSSSSSLLLPPRKWKLSGPCWNGWTDSWNRRTSSKTPVSKRKSDLSYFVDIELTVFYFFLIFTHRLDVKPIVNTLNDDEILTDDEDDDFIYWKVKGNKRSYPRKYWSPRNSPTFKRIALNQKPLLELSAEKIAKKADESEEHDSEQAEFVDKLAESIKSDNADVKPLITNMDLTLISKEIIVGIIDKDTEDNEEQPNIISQVHSY